MSVRDYSNQVPSPEDIEYILECIRLAPSAVNFQPFKIRYITNEGDLKKLHQCYAREWFKTAPACFIIYRNKTEEWVRKFDNKPHGDIDAAIAIEHLCLAAAERHLGTCWICNYDPESLEKHFPTPANLEAVALIPIGHPTSEENPIKKRKDQADLLL
jgi:nitroreductase